MIVVFTVLCLKLMTGIFLFPLVCCYSWFRYYRRHPYLVSPSSSSSLPSTAAASKNTVPCYPYHPNTTAVLITCYSLSNRHHNHNNNLPHDLTDRCAPSLARVLAQQLSTKGMTVFVDDAIDIGITNNININNKEYIESLQRHVHPHRTPVVPISLSSPREASLIMNRHPIVKQYGLYAVIHICREIHDISPLDTESDNPGNNNNDNTNIHSNQINTSRILHHHHHQNPIGSRRGFGVTPPEQHHVFNELQRHISIDHGLFPLILKYRDLHINVSPRIHYIHPSHSRHSHIPVRSTQYLTFLTDTLQAYLRLLRVDMETELNQGRDLIVPVPPGLSSPVWIAELFQRWYLHPEESFSGLLFRNYISVLYFIWSSI